MGAGVTGVGFSMVMVVLLQKYDGKCRYPYNEVTRQRLQILDGTLN
jgi:hypothetical protein